MIKLVLLDMDGTLCNGKSEVPARFKQVVDQLDQQGIAIGIATGRDANSLKHNFPNTFEEMACVTLNGSINIYKGKVISSQIMDSSAAKTCLEMIQEMDDVSAQIYHTDGSYQKVAPQWYHDWFRNIGAQYKIIEDVRFGYDNLIFITMTAFDLETNYKEKFMNIPHLQAIYSGAGCVDLSNIGISKGSGMREIAKYLHITSEEVMAIGDAGNDVELLKSVGVPVAMANATDEVKSIAKYITEKPNTEEGCIDFLVNYFHLDVK